MIGWILRIFAIVFGSEKGRTTIGVWVTETAEDFGSDEQEEGEDDCSLYAAKHKEAKSDDH